VLKWIVFALVAVAVVVFLLRGGLRYLANFFDWARRLLEALQAFWDGLFGRREAAAEYLDDLAEEIRLVAARLDPARPVAQLHLGGGTPTFLPPEQLRRLGALVRQHFHFTPDAEISVEVDPRRLTHDHVVALRELGANRASLGVQDTDPRVQLAIHRLQPHMLNYQAVGWLRAEGFHSINVDLIYGLPLQTASSFGRTLDDVLTLEPDRLSVFSYAHIPWLKPAQLIFEKREELPPPEAKLEMFMEAHARLTGCKSSRKSKAESLCSHLSTVCV